MMRLTFFTQIHAFWQLDKPIIIVGMDEVPPRALLNTFRVAVALKLVGVIVALVTGYLLLEQWQFRHWWMAVTTGAVLLLLLAPWPHWFPSSGQRLFHLQLVAAITVAIIGAYLDLIQSLWVPTESLFRHPLFIERLNWTAEQVHNIHALGILFVIVPVVLASWQYGFWGMRLSLALAGTLYIATPFLLPSGAFTWGIYAIRGFVLLGTTLILAFTTNTLATAQRRQQAAVHQANQQLAAANRQLAEQAGIMEQLATSRERNRLARELHDTLAHSLSGTAVQLQAVSTLQKVDPEAAVAELIEAQKQIKHGLEEARRAIAALRASPLEELGLAEALCQRAFNLGERSGLTVHCHVDETLPDLSPLVEQAIYRIADEALVNAEKHAQATEIRVSLVRIKDVSGNHDNGLRLEVRDNGVGFDGHVMTNKTAKEENGRFGLIGMIERAKLIGAELKIDSAPTQGTRIWLNVG